MVTGQISLSTCPDHHTGVGHRGELVLRFVSDPDSLVETRRQRNCVPCNCSSHSHNTTTAALCSVAASFEVILLANKLIRYITIMVEPKLGQNPHAFSLAFHTIVVVLDVVDLQSLLA
jgi:hypothetical protein